MSRKISGVEVDFVSPPRREPRGADEDYCRGDGSTRKFSLAAFCILIVETRV